MLNDRGTIWQRHGAWLRGCRSGRTDGYYRDSAWARSRRSDRILDWHRGGSHGLPLCACDLRRSRAAITYLTWLPFVLYVVGGFVLGKMAVGTLHEVVARRRRSEGGSDVTQPDGRRDLAPGGAPRLASGFR